MSQAGLALPVVAVCVAARERTASGLPSSFSLRLIVVLNGKLFEVIGDGVTQEQAFAHANDVLKNAVGGVFENVLENSSDIIHIPGLVNVDFEDVKTVMSEPCKAMGRTAAAGGPDRANRAAELAVACPLKAGIDLSGARGLLVLIATSKATFKLSASPSFASAAMTIIRRFAADDAHVIFGTAYDESLSDQLRVTLIATGLSSAARKAEVRGDGRHDGRNPAPLSVLQQPQHVLRSGTDNLPILNHQLGVQPHRAGTPQTRSYDGLNNPSVWRSARSQSAAKVDALSSNGMDKIEMPAFLRKQAD